MDDFFVRDISVVPVFSSVTGSFESHALFDISEIVPVVILNILVLKLLNSYIEIISVTSCMWPDKNGE